MDATRPDYEAEIARLRAENAELKARLADAEKRAQEQSATIDRLKTQLDKLAAALEEAQRSGKRQAAPFRKTDGPKAEPKKPGRKSGKRHGKHAHRTKPPKIDELYDVPLPDVCPHCGGVHVAETHVNTQYQTEIPRTPIYRQFDVHIGECQDCGHRVQGRHELQTSDALGAAASQLGPDAHAAMVILNKDLGLSHGKCARVFSTMFGIPVSRATSARSNMRTAKLAEPAYEQLRIDVRGSPFVVPDETGWRVGGRNAWLHGFVGENATVYDIGDRSHKIAADLLGIDWAGTMIHDGYSIYDCFHSAMHQQCLAHLQRRCQKILDTAVGAAVQLPRTVLRLIDEAFALRRAWRGHRLSGDDLAMMGLWLGSELEDLTSGTFTYEPNRLLAGHIQAHALQWFYFLIDPTIDATNYRAEQAMRPGVVNRKVWGGNRTWLGATTQKVLMSVSRTLIQRGQDVLNWLSRLRRSTTPLLLPAPLPLLLPAGAR
jgi:transposase